MDQKARPGADIGLAIVLIALGVLIIHATLDLPPGTFEPLGSATIPQVVAGLIIVFSVWMLVQALAERRELAARGARNAAEPDAEEPVRQRFDLSVTLVALTFVYVLVMAMDWARFSLATGVFLVASIGLLAGFTRRNTAVILALAVGFGVGLEYLFTEVFVIDLP